jgi:subtilase family serine protease
MSTGRFHVGRKKPHVSLGRRSLALIPLLFLFVWGTLFTLHTSPFAHLTNAQASGLTKLGGHVPGLIKKSTLLGPTDPNTPVSLLIGLHPRNEANLKDYVDALSRKHSTTEHRYLTPAQVTTAFAPLPGSQSVLIAYMQQAGFSESQTYRHHLLIGFSGTIGEAENAFHVQINNYRAPGGREFYAPTSDPSVPTTLSTVIQSVIGLDSARVYSHPPIVSRKHTSTNIATSNSSSCIVAQPGPSYSYYTPNQIATAYNGDAGIHRWRRSCYGGS